MQCSTIAVKRQVLKHGICSATWINIGASFEWQEKRAKHMLTNRDYLLSEVLFKKCLHGRTHNNNEAINGFIWKRLPKDVFVGWYTLQIGVSSAVPNFNSGAHGLVDVFENLGMSAGFFTKEFCTQRDSNREDEKEDVNRGDR